MGAIAGLISGAAGGRGTRVTAFWADWMRFFCFKDLAALRALFFLAMDFFTAPGFAFSTVWRECLTVAGAATAGNE